MKKHILTSLKDEEYILGHNYENETQVKKFILKKRVYVLFPWKHCLSRNG